MFKLRHVLSYSFLALSSINPANSFWEYKDGDGKTISFRIVPKDDTSGEDEKRLLVTTFSRMYQGYKPSALGDQFHTHEDVDKFLVKYFDENWKHLEEDSNKLIHLRKDGNLIGVAIVEENGDTLHLRHFAIQTSEQGHGYGKTFIDALKRYSAFQVHQIIADTHRVYDETREFYRKTGFKEGNPHEEELKGSGLYIGLEWESWAYTLGRHKDLLTETQYRRMLSLIEMFRGGNLPKIASPEIKAIPIVECGETLVDVEEGLNPRIQMMPNPESHFQSPDCNSGYHCASQMRETLYKKLEDMITQLDGMASRFEYKPGQISIRVFEGLRSLETQKQLFEKKATESRDALLKGERFLLPHLSDEEILTSDSFKAKVYEETIKWVSPVENNTPVHSTGGAVDIRLFDEEQQMFVDLGKFGAVWGSNPAASTFSEQITYQQKQNRLMLLIAATRADLTNYPFEFWHFSSGDRYAAFSNELDALKRRAIYGGI